MSEPAAPAHRTPGPALVPVKMHLHSPADPAEGVVVSTERCTRPKSSAFVRHVTFDVSGSKLAGVLRPGQAFGVLPPGFDEHAKPHKLRLYSVASPTKGEEGRGNVIATTVKRTLTEDEHGRLKLGIASNYLCDLRPGDRVRLTGPSGKRFVLPADAGAHDYLFFATGTGIAPFRAMLLDLLEAGAAVPSKIVLVMGSPYATDLLYDDQMRALAARHPNFRYLTSLSRERQEERDGGGAPGYVHDRLRTHRDELVPLLAGPRGLIYVCGIAGMELGVLQGLARALPQAALEPYLRVDPAAGDPGGWERTMIHRLITPTRRVFVEVY